MAKQIDEQLLFDLIKYHVLAYEDNGLNYKLFRSAEFEKSLTKRLSEKWLSWQKQIAFTKYKTAPEAEQREKSRNDYLDLQGITKDFKR